MSEHFVADGWRIPAAWVLVFAMPAMGLVYLSRASDADGLLDVLGLVAGAFFLGAGFVLWWGLAHRRRPVIEVSDDAVEFVSIYPLARRKRIGLAQIERVDLVGTRMDVTLHSGEVLPLRIPALSPERRRAARAAIERRIARE